MRENPYYFINYYISNGTYGVYNGRWNNRLPLIWSNHKNFLKFKILKKTFLFDNMYSNIILKEKVS